jgi:prephenate dehydratase
MNFNLKIAYQGIKGAFSYLAALKRFGEDASYVGLPNFSAVFASVEKGESDFAVIPYENSLIGTIYENCDLMAQTSLNICGEHSLRIEHSLLVHPEVEKIEKIRKISSHIKALKQCKNFFTKHPWITQIIHEDTAGAARDVARLKQPECGAIAHASCASIYGLRVLESNIEDHKNNYTRFLYLSKKDTSQDFSGNKAMVLFVLKHAPKTLHTLLAVIAERNVNIRKIEARPHRGSAQPFEYLFYLDLEWDQKENSEESINEIFWEMKKITEQFHCLGIYQAEQLWHR